jgi:hypothetical protein
MSARLRMRRRCKTTAASRSTTRAFNARRTLVERGRCPVPRRGTACRALGCRALGRRAVAIIPVSAKDDDAVQMIWHDGECIELRGWEMRWYRLPENRHCLPIWREIEHIASDLCEEAEPVTGANRDEVRAGPGIVTAAEADGATMLCPYLFSLRQRSSPRSAAGQSG